MNEEFAAPEEVELARRIHCADSDGDIEIDEPARISRGADGIWVQGWLFLSNESIAASGFGELN